ncbi:MAG: cation:proton antiporter [Caldilineaceae bacterium]
MLGYIAAGIGLGYLTAGTPLMVSINPELLVELGATLLLFALGIEFSLKTLASVPRVAFFGAPLQMCLTSTYGFGLGMVLGWEWRVALLFGLLVALSATLLVQAPLVDHCVGSTHAKAVVMALLTMQHLLIIPVAFLLTLPYGETFAFASIIVAILEGILFLLITLFVGIWVLPRLLALLGANTTPELRDLLVLAGVAIVTYGAYLFALPFVLVAFAIGLSLSESSLSRHTMQELLRVRGIFTFLFFVGVGLLFNLDFFLRHWHAVLFIVIVVTVGKSLILALTTYLAGERNGIPPLAALGLFQVGEMSIILIWLGWQRGIVDNNIYALLIASILVMMALTPFVVRLAPSLPKVISRRGSLGAGRM